MYDYVMSKKEVRTSIFDVYFDKQYNANNHYSFVTEYSLYELMYYNITTDSGTNRPTIYTYF